MIAKMLSARYTESLGANPYWMNQLRKRISNMVSRPRWRGLALWVVVPSVVLVVIIWALATLPIIEAMVVVGLVADILTFLAYSGIIRYR